MVVIRSLNCGTHLSLIPSSSTVRGSDSFIIIYDQQEIQASEASKLALVISILKHQCLLGTNKH